MFYADVVRAAVGLLDFYLVNGLIVGLGVGFALLAWRRAARAGLPVPSWAQVYLPFIVSTDPRAFSRFEHEPTRRQVLASLWLALLPVVQTGYALHMAGALLLSLVLEGLAHGVFLLHAALGRLVSRPL